VRSLQRLSAPLSAAGDDRGRWAAPLVALAAVFCGYALFNGVHAIPYLAGPWLPEPARSRLLAFTTAGGFAAGAVVQGRLADRAGRRPAILLGLWLIAIFSCATAACGGTVPSFVAWRFLTGAAAGVLLPSGVTYLHEIATGVARTTVAASVSALGLWIGASAAASAAVYVTPVYGWRMVYALGAGSGLVALTCHLRLRESPAFLSLRRLVEAAGDQAVGDAPPFPVSCARRRPVTVDQPFTGFSLFLPAYRRRTVAVCGASFFGMFAASGFLGWLPLALLQQGETGIRHQLARSAALSLIFFGTLGCGFAIDRLKLGRLAPVTWWLLGGAGAVLLDYPHRDWIMLAAMFVAAFGLLGAQGGLCSLTADMCRTEIRSTAVGAMLGTGAVGALLAPSAISVLQQYADRQQAVFVSLGAAAWLAAAILAAAPDLSTRPHTAGAPDDPPHPSTE
jgi:MFS family permease